MLELSGITQTFGGVTALRDVSFTAAAGNITGVIGPNGAGKTTLFNIISGVCRRTSGVITLAGKDISDAPAERLARFGLVRTFQNVELFNTMTAIENVMVARHSRSSAGLLACAFRMPWALREEERIRIESERWLEFTGVSDLADVPAGNLPLGKGRLLEIARALAAEPCIILMDEPAAGLNSRETLGLARLIREIRDMGITIILVEHDMDLVMEICDHIVALNLGEKIAEGSPREIQENPEVIAAYLGDG